MIYAVYEDSSYNWLFYLHSYYCFQKHANSNDGFPCGFDIAAVAAVAAFMEVLHQPYVPVSIAVVVVAAIATTAEVVAVTSIPKILKVLAVLEVLAVAAQSLIQHNLHGIFKNRLSNWNSQI